MVQSKKVISLMVCALIFCAGSTPARAAERWFAVNGDGYQVVTDAGASPASDVARRVVEMRRLLGAPVKVLPLRVVLLASDSLFSALRPSSNAGGFYQSSANEDWIVARWNLPDSERAISHEMVHAFLEHNGPRRPLWLEEGLAEFYSTAQLDGKGWIIGQPIARHVQLLQNRRWLGEREFFEARYDSPLRNEAARESLFYAQSWAIVHYLLTAPPVRQKAPEFFEALADGVPLARAAEAILGQRQGVLIDSARHAVEQRAFRTARIDADAATRPPEPIALSAAEANAIVVSLSIVAGRPDLAAREAGSPTQRGLVALRDGRHDDAERFLQQAVAESTPDPAAYFELAMLLRDSKREPERVSALLRQTVERNPNHAEAHFILGLGASAAGDNETAIDSFQRAAQILPRQANFWHALALALEKANRRAEAGHAALRCRQASRNPAERQMAAAIERLVNEPQLRAAAPRKPEVEIPKSWQGLHGDAIADGDLTEFDCLATPPIAHISTGVDRLALRVEKPNAIRISGTGAMHHTLACGPQKSAVRVEYLHRTNELTAIEFK